MIKNFDELIENTDEKFKDVRKDALEILNYVLEEMNGYNVVKNSIKAKDDVIFIKDKKINLLSYKRIFIIGFGKASGSMAKAMEEIVDFDKGAVITTEDIYLRKIKLYKGTHPFPSKKNIEATEKVLEILRQADEEDLVIALISGGGSSLLCKPRISLESMIEVTRKLMERGCDIEELNTVRKHLSYVKGGQLAKLTNAKIIGLIISDIIGNPVEFISSGATSEDKTTYEDAMKILKKYGIKNKEAISIIKKGMKGEIEETPKKLDNVENIIIADIEAACKKASKMAREKEYHAKILTTKLRGEAREIGTILARYVKFYPRYRSVIICGGETTVKVIGKGKGGRNQELVLSSIKEIANEPIVMLSFGTDGIDGNSPAGGAIADGSSYRRARELALDIDVYLKENNSYEFFEKMGDAIITGYTGTNVMDIQIMIKM